MRVLIAPDSFKGTITAASAARALAEGWRRGRPDDEIRELPLADGGEGTIDAVAAAFPGSRRMPAAVTGPDGRPVIANWLLLKDNSAVVELAASSGLPLMRALDPLGAHTLGLGETLAAVVAAGCRRVDIGLGGSASTDGGSGAMRALGARFLDAAGDELPLGGGSLVDLARVERGRTAAPPPVVRLLVDVTAPLFGPGGAAFVYGPQKGATPADVERLDLGLRRLAAISGGDAAAPGMGAAGGTAYGLAALWHATIAPGAATIAELLGLDGEIDAADIVVTGEGRFDDTSRAGKVVGHVIARATGHARIHVVAGAVDPGAARDVGAAVSLTDIAGSGAAAMSDPARWLAEAGARLAKAAAP